MAPLQLEKLQWGAGSIEYQEDLRQEKASSLYPARVCYFRDLNTPLGRSAHQQERLRPRVT